MPRSSTTLVAILALGLSTAAAPAALAKGPAKKTAKATKAPAKKKVPPPSAEHKKKLAELFGGFKFGMTRDEVIAGFSKQLDERYEELIKATTDVAEQDRLRKRKKIEANELKRKYIEFVPNKPSPWDVSIVEGEFAHGTEEAMTEHWENQGGKNQRRFFFFYQGRLWKMLVSLDVSILPADKKNFETFTSVMQGQYGPGHVEGGRITWHAGAFDVRAIDKLRDYDALALVIEDPTIRKDIIALREAKAPPKKETNAVIKAVIDVDNKDHPDVKGDSSAIDAVIKAQGGR
ncbi:MAG: hypothetical protein AB7P03_25875 [Kofleriaceae bacterium]